MNTAEKSSSSESSSLTRVAQLPPAIPLDVNHAINGHDGGKQLQEDRTKGSNLDVSAVLTLQIRKQPPEAVFLEEGFEVSYILMGNSGGIDKLQQSNGAFALTASLVDQAPESVSRRVSICRLIILDRPAPLKIGVPGMIRCSITASVGREDQIFNATVRTRLCATAVLTDIGAPSHKTVATVLSSEFAIVRYKILASPSVDWSSIWYKDEGGRDKCMEVIAGVYDHHRALLYENIPLLLTLCYSGKRGAPPIRVTNQEILRVIGPKMNKLKIDESTGNVKIRFRIEDVSKNHQGQDFCVKIAAAADRTRVAPGLTPPITIRSKRNKRRLSSSAPADVAAVADTKGRSRNTVTNSSIDGQDSLRFKEAVRGVVQWADDVVTSLYPMMWQVVGFAQDADGNLDYSRPYHNMVNPNGTISRVLTIYNESTREHLNHLQRATGQNFSQPMGGSLSREMTTYSSRSVTVPPMPRDSMYKMAPFGYPPINPRGTSAFASHPPHSHQQSIAQQPAMFPRPHQMDTVSAAEVERGRAQSNLAYLHPSANNSTVGQVGSVHKRLPASVPTPASPGNDVVDLVNDDKEVSAAKPIKKTCGTSSPSTSSNRECDVEYLLAKQFKSLRTGERLGFPAYSSSKELLGFYQDPCKFIPICRLSTDFGSVEKRQATEILEQAMSAFSDSVHSIKQWGSITNMLNHALVYEWSKGLAATTKDDAKATDNVIGN